jgi:hypothetical protein
LHQVFHNVEADKFYLIEEGKDELRPQQFTRRTALNPGTIPTAPTGSPVR